LYVAKAELFKALAHPIRIRILELLVEGDQTVSNLAADTGLDASSLSQHLAVVKRTGMVSSIRRGNAVTYQLTDSAVADFLTTARRVLALRLESVRESLAGLHDADE
jgi:DNA-binding transcriptional ArsR family regulator